MLINIIYILIVLILIFVTIVAIRAIKSGLDSREIKSNETFKDDIKEKNLIENLNELNNLYAKGIISQEEFEKAKKKILE